MGGAGKRSSVARNSVGGLVMVESILFKRLSIRAQGWWNGDAKTIPAVLQEFPAQKCSSIKKVLT